jgi:hypothetical protein
MIPTTKAPNLQDDRWGGYVPWFLRHPDLAVLGRFDLFFDRVAHRVEQFFLYDEGGRLNVPHMGALIESESHQCFRFNNLHNSLALAVQIRIYFSSAQINREVDSQTKEDSPVIQVNKNFEDIRDRLFKKFGLHNIDKMMEDPSYVAAQKKVLDITLTHYEHHRGPLVRARLTVLESVLRLVQQTPTFSKLRADLRRYLAEAQIMLDIAEKDGQFVPMEEALLQKEVIDRLLPRLATRFPQQEKDLVKAYHDLVQGVDTDTVFVNAVKALEEIARTVSGEPKLTLEDQMGLKDAFHNLHPTIYTTITKLAAHRGDKAGHGREGPPLYEMRYLLFSICNIALLFLDHPGSAHS